MGKTISADNVSSKLFLFHDTQWNYRVKEHLAQEPKRVNKLLALTEGFSEKYSYFGSIKLIVLV